MDRHAMRGLMQKLFYQTSLMRLHLGKPEPKMIADIEELDELLAEANTESERSEMKRDDLDKRFGFRMPRNGQTRKYAEIRGEAKLFATTICDLCPESDERDAAITKIDEAMLWANASIARHG